MVALAAGLGYALLTGMHVPILRSFLMASLFTLAVLAGRRAISLRGLALAAIALMLAEPQEVPGVSFQMSFSAVLALISGYAALRPWLNRLRGEKPVAAVRRLPAGAGADQRAGGHRVGAVRGVPFRPGAGLFRARQHGGGAADGAVGHAARGCCRCR